MALLIAGLLALATTAHAVLTGGETRIVFEASVYERMKEQGVELLAVPPAA
jgi:hypothetical protein